MSALYRVSDIPGRVRWRVSGLYLNAPLGDRLAQALAVVPGVIEVTSNARTGRTLVIFGEGTTSAEHLEAVMLREMTPAEAAPADRPALARPSRDIRLGVLCSGAAALASLARIFFLRRTLGTLLARRRTPAAAVLKAAPSTALMLASTALYIRMKRENRLVWSRLGRRRALELRMEVARRIAGADLAALDRLSMSTLANTVRSGLADIERGYDGAGELVYIAANTLVLSAAFVVLAPRLSWIPLVVLAAMAVDARRSQLPVQRRYQEAAASRTLADGRLTELIDGLTTVKAYGLTRRELDLVLASGRDHQDASTDVARLATQGPLRLELITLLGVDAVALGAGLALAGGAMAPATHVALIAIAGHLFYAFGTLGPALDGANRGWAATTALRDVTRIPVEGDRPRFEVAAVPPRSAITLDGVDFRYATRQPLALRGVDLRIPAGAFVGVVGPSGSGKSTIMKLLLRFYDPLRGTIRIDGTDIRSFDRAELRALIATVDQQSFVFEDTIAENIAVGRESAGQQEIRDVARAALLDEFVEHLPEGYATATGARGVRLSDGQRQRLLIARALLKAAPVVVLDEATSNVDPTTEEALLENIRARTAGRTLIVIAHRLAAVKDADTIFVLDGGRLVESGRHTDLIARGGVYSALWRSQQRDRTAGA